MSRGLSSGIYCSIGWPPPLDILALSRHIRARSHEWCLVVDARFRSLRLPSVLPLRPTLIFVYLTSFHQAADRCVPVPGVCRGWIAWTVLSDFRNEWGGNGFPRRGGGAPYRPSLPSASILPLGLLRLPHMLRYLCSFALLRCILGLYQDHA